MLLAGDIGGTKTDLAIYSTEKGPRAPLVQAEFHSQDYKSLSEMAAEFLAKSKLDVDTACFNVAGPVTNGAVKLTNLPWHLDEVALAKALGLQSVHLLNDLEAVAYAVPSLQPNELITINQGSPAPGSAIAIIAPGTGLGEAFLTNDGGGYHAYASEGGHADFAPTSELQIELLQYLLQRFEHVSFERVCSGIGLPNIYAFLSDNGHGSEAPSTAARLSATPDQAHAIISAAFDPADPSPLCLATVDMFSAILAAESGNFALKVLAAGGIYLGGGIATHVVPRLQPAFTEAFKRKGRFSEMLQNIPVHVITAQAALLGAATYGLNPPTKPRQPQEKPNS